VELTREEVLKRMEGFPVLGSVGYVLFVGGVMVKKLRKVEDVEIKRPPRAKLSREEVLKRMAEIDQRKENIIAAVRKDKN
jgi:hypothetical protein